MICYLFLFCLKGVPCEVLFSTLTEIKCRTGPSDGVKNIYPGEDELSLKRAGAITCRIVR